MTQIKIEVPANDTIALNAFAEALQRIAAERAHVDLTPKGDDFIESVKKDYEASCKNVKTPNSFDTVVTFNDEVERTDTAWQEMDKVYAEHVENLPEGMKQGEPCTQGDVDKIEGSLANDTIDADGIPWDKRIHSKGKSRLADNTWRLRKRPADKDEDEWTTYIDTVKAELKAVQDIEAPTLDEPQATATVQNAPSVTTNTDVNDIEYQKIQGVIAPDCKVEVTLNGDTVTVPEADVQSPVTPPSTVIPPVAAVTPPASVTPPVADEPAVKTFPELMKYITTSAAKRGANNDMIKEVLLEVDASLTAIPLIANRVDLIPTFVEKLEVRLA